MNTINVLYQHDNNYAVFGGVSMLSLFENNKEADHICVYFIDVGLSDEYKKQYRELAERYDRRVVFLDGTPYVKYLEEAGMPKYRGSYATYMKLFVCEMLPDDVERIYYLDSDTLVTGNLRPLFEMDMEGKALWMAIDGMSLNFKEIYGFSKKEPYFCGGTMLIDVKQWKRQQYTKRLIDYAVNVRSAYFAVDQDLMNNAFKGEIGVLDARYDFLYIHTIYNDKMFLKRYKGSAYYTESELIDARNHIAVLHFMRFLGESPWNAETLHPHKKEFDKYLAISPWKDYVKKASGKKGIFVVEKVMYRYLPRALFFKIFMTYYSYYVKKADRELKSVTSKNVGY